jgi:hypothetical protein
MKSKSIQKSSMCTFQVLESVVMMFSGATLTSGVLSLFGQFTEGGSESGVSRLGNGVPICKWTEWTDRGSGARCRRDHS